MSSTAGDPTPIDQGLFLLHLNRARRGVRTGDLAAAWDELAQARSLRPRDDDVLNLVSILEFKQGHYEEAAAAARVLIEKNPDSEILQANLGLILFKAGRLAEAEGALQAAIELKPSHRRSHLYLGLLYQTRGKLGLAVEHLRIAGAARRVAQIVEALRRAGRDASAKPAAAEAGTSLPLEARETSTRTRTATFGPGFLEETEEKGARIAPAASDARPLFKIRPDGGLEIASRGTVFVRKGSVAWYSGKIAFAPEPAFRGTSLERILRASGPGTLLLSDPGRRAYRRDLNGHVFFVEGTRLLALDHGLTSRLDAIHDFRRSRRLDVLKVQGHGSVVFSVGGPVAAHEVSPGLPLSISSRDLVAWSGELVASVLDDQFLEEVMQPDVANPPKIRFEGEGTVLTEPPRPRRRASDADRPTDQRRG